MLAGAHRARMVVMCPKVWARRGTSTQCLASGCWLALSSAMHDELSSSSRSDLPLGWTVASMAALSRCGQIGARTRQAALGRAAFRIFELSFLYDLGEIACSKRIVHEGGLRQDDSGGNWAARRFGWSGRGQFARSKTLPAAGQERQRKSQ